MAKKKSATGVNKSELIREYMKEFPEKKPKEVAEFISAQTGEKITPLYVSTIKSNDKKRAGKKPGKRGRKAATATNGTVTGGGFAPGSFSRAMPVFKAAGELLKLAGDKATAREVLEMVAALRS